MDKPGQMPSTPPGGEPKRLAELVAHLDEESRPARREAIRELRALGPAAAEALPALREAYDARLIKSKRDFDLRSLPHDEVEAALAYIELSQDLDARSLGLSVICKVPRDAQYAIPTLLKVFREEEGNPQSSAMSALSVIGRGDPEVIHAFVDALNPTDRGFSDTVAFTLSCFGLEVVPYLQDALADPALHDFAVRAMLSEETAAATPMPKLIKALRGDDPPLREWAAWCLGRSARSGREVAQLASAITDLSEVTLTDEDPDIAENAGFVLYTLHSKGEPRAFDYLFEALAGDDATLRQRALRTFRSMIVYMGVLSTSPEVEAAFRNALRDESPDVRSEAIESLRLAGVSELPHLIAALQNERSDVRQLAAHALGEGVWFGELGDHCIVDTSEPEIPVSVAACARAALINSLNDDVPAVRAEAAGAIMRFTSPVTRAMAAVGRALTHEDVDVRLRVALQLQALKVVDPASVQRVASEGPASDNANDRLDAASARAALAKALKDETPAVRAAASIVMERFASSEAEVVAALSNALTDEDVGVRLSAASTLQALDAEDSSDVQRLAMAVLASDNAGSRYAVLRLLTTASTKTRDAAAALKLGEICTRSRIWPPVMPMLIAALQDENSHTRHSVALTLNSLGESVGDPLAALGNAIKDADARINDAQALGAFAAEAVPAVREKLESEGATLRREAADALEALKRAVRTAGPALEKASGDEDRHVRDAAGRALRAIRS